MRGADRFGAPLVLGAILGALLAATAPAAAQDMLRNVDLAQPAYSQSEFTRADKKSRSTQQKKGK